MLSREARGLASPRTRRGTALSWTILFILSLLLQYATFALAPAALAVHDEGFQLDGNAVDEGAGDDWDNLAGADASIFITDGVPERAFEIGDKDTDDTDEWDQGIHNVPDKDDILHAFAALYDDTIYFGADRYSNDGDAQVGFWFFKNGIGLTADGFTPVHTDGDLLVVSHFTNGGTTSTIELYEWVGSGGSEGSLDLLATGQTCTLAPAADQACAIANTGEEASPWSYQAKDSKVDPNVFPANAFYEGGLDLTKVYDGNVPCFSAFLVETRSSQEITATLKDFVTGDFNTCAPPDIETDASASSIELGGSVTDTATMSGDDGPAAGTVDFFVCGPNASATACESGGTKVGGTVDVDTTEDGGTATSASFTPTETGWYCFRAEYLPNSDSQYLEVDHTNATSECFEVTAPHIAITKTANPVGPVSAGDTIGFDITVTSDGNSAALGVEMTDKLPGGINWTADAPTGDTTGVACSIKEGWLTCTDASMAAGDSFSVHISGVTDAADCGTIENTASVDTDNDGDDTATADVVVACPDIEVVKDASDNVIPAGQDLEFTITTTNIGAGVARDVVLTDVLPAGFDWSVDDEACDIAGGTLTCEFGDLGPEEAVTVTLTAPTSAQGDGANIDCGDDLSVVIDNTGSATSTNEGSDVLENNSDDATIEVLCSALLIDKSFTGNTAGTDPDLGVPAANIGDTLHYTLEYGGAGPLTNAVITDVLPQGLDYVDGSAEGDANFTFVSYVDATRTLTWTAATLPDPASGAVTYDVTVLATAPDFAQPLVNVATIDSDQTPPDSDTQPVAVLAPPLELTPPPTTTLTPQSGMSNPGFALMLILLGVAGLMLGIGFITPVPGRVRKERNQG